MTTPISRLQISLFLTFTAFAVLIASGSAAAATTLGQNCASTSSGPQTAFQKSIASGASYTSPIDGVITHWGVNKTGTSGTTSSALIIGSETSPSMWTVRAMSPLLVAAGSTTTEGDVRIGIKASEGIGFISVTGGGALCNTLNASDLIAYSNSFVDAGSSYMENGAPQYLIPIFATVEADIDKDGYGDESQDKCPQSAALQNPCPVLAISQKLTAAKGAIAITAAASVDTSLIAAATVKLPKLGSKKASTVTFSSKATAFSAGQIGSIKLKLPSRVKSALAATKKSKKLKFSVTLSGNGLANTATSVKSISLRGTKR